MKATRRSVGLVRNHLPDDLQRTLQRQGIDGCKRQPDGVRHMRGSRERMCRRDRDTLGHHPTASASARTSGSNGSQRKYDHGCATGFSSPSTCAASPRDGAVLDPATGNGRHRGRRVQGRRADLAFELRNRFARRSHEADTHFSCRALREARHITVVSGASQASGRGPSLARNA